MLVAIIQIIASFFGVIGFSIMFNIHGKKLFVIGFGGALCWGVYEIIYVFLQDKIIACLGATLVIAAFVELLSRLIKTPIILLLVPMILPLIPGSDLYYMMLNFVLQNTAEGGRIGYLLLGETGAIALGIILVTSLTQIIVKIGQFIKIQKIR